jgi:hypothetical protein
VKFGSLVEETLHNPRLEVEKKSSAFWPSEGGITYELHGRPYREGGCNRSVWYRLTGQKKDGRGSSLKSLIEQGFGHYVQSRLAETAKQGRFFLGEEVPIQLTRRKGDLLYAISGSIDIIIQDPTTGRPVILEIKTTGKAFFGQVRPTKEGVMRPNTSHVIQVLPYLEWARTEGGIQDPEAHLFYVDRVEADYGEHIVRLNQQGQAVVENDVGIETWEAISMPALYADFDTTALAVREGVPPPRPYTPQYDNVRLKWMYDNGLLNKTDTEKLRKGLEKNDDYLSPDSPPVLAKGDYPCKWCPFLKTCYGSVTPGFGGNIFNMPTAESGPAEVPV